MKESFYFSHDSNARNDEKILAVRMRFGVEGYGIYFMLIERMREESDYMSIKDYNSLAFDFRVSADKVKSIVEDFGLFSFTEDGKRFYSESFMKRMTIKDGKKQRRSNAARMKWESVKGGSLNASDLRSKRLSEARKKGTHTKEEWAEMLEFFGQCLICGEKETLVKDHIKPIYQGGDDSIKNLQPLCKSCNSRKGPDSTDHRVTFCAERGVEMPEKWGKTPAKRLQCSSETPPNKVKESKVNNIISSSPYQDKKIVELWNSTCIDFAKVIKLTDARKNKIRVRLGEFSSDKEQQIEVVKKIFEKTQASKFLRGDNRNGWKASFDWIFENSKNWVKILEGNYDNDKSPNGWFGNSINNQNTDGHETDSGSTGVDFLGQQRKAYIQRAAAEAVAECNSRSR